MPNRLTAALKAAAMTWAGGGSGVWMGGSWGRFDKLTDPWPRDARYNWERAAGEAYLNSVVATCIGWMQRAFPEPQLRVWTVDGDEPVDGHDLTRLFRRPNPYASSGRLWQSVIRDWVLCGNAYLRKERTNGGGVAALYYLPARLVKPDFPKGGKSKVFISQYLYGPGGEEEPIDPQDIIHLRFGEDPDNARLGWSPLRAGTRELAVLNKGADYRVTLLDKTGVPPYVANPKDPTKPVTEDGANRIKALFRNLVRPGNNEPLMFPTIPLEFTRLGFSPQELDILKMMGWDAEVICSLIGLSTMVVNLPSESKTYSNYPEAYRAAVEHCLVPTQRLFADELTVQLLPDVGGNAETEYVGWDYSKVRCLQEDEHKLWMRVIQARKERLLTPNEARDRLDTDLEDVEGGDELTPPVPPALAPFAGAPPESSGDAAVNQPASLNGAGITAGRFKALAGVFGE